MRLDSPVPVDTPPPALPRIGQANYLSLLIEALRSVHPPDHFDARIFVGLLMAIVAGEKNLIVDVDVRDLVRELKDAAEHRQPYERGTPLANGAVTSLQTEFSSSIASLETRVQRTVESVSHLRTVGISSVIQLMV
jgi:hypothetical protein